LSSNLRRLQFAPLPFSHSEISRKRTQSENERLLPPNPTILNFYNRKGAEIAKISVADFEISKDRDTLTIKMNTWRPPIILQSYSTSILKSSQNEKQNENENECLSHPIILLSYSPVILANEHSPPTRCLPFDEEENCADLVYHRPTTERQ
jgi:hypothetical protein